MEGFEIEAIASVIDKDSFYLNLIDSLKPGDGSIELRYGNSSSSEHPYLGSITVYSNGIITLTVSNKLYANRLYYDYKTISGESYEPKPEYFSPYGELVSKDFDKGRFLRIRDFIKEHNISLTYAEEEKIADYYFNKYFALTDDDLLNGSEKLEKKDYDDGEYHNTLN